MSSSRIVSGTKNVTTAGTEVQLSSTNVGVDWVVICPRPANTGVIVIGDSSVVATAGSERGAVIPANGIVLPVVNLDQIYIDASVSGEGVSFIYGVSVA